jgi:hypothetical protein
MQYGKWLRALCAAESLGRKVLFMNHKNGSENLFTRVNDLLLTGEFAEAEQLLDEPLSREAILSWTRLRLFQGQAVTAVKRVWPLMEAFPTDPYYLLAAAEIMLEESSFTPRGFAALFDWVRECAGGSPDVLAKIGFAATMRGQWSYGMRCFLEALRIKEELKLKTAGTEVLILFWKRNRASVLSHLHDLECVDGRMRGDTYDDLPLEVIVRTVYILVTAKLEGGIPEAWPVALRLACNHREISEAWREQKLVPLFSRFCFNWIGIETTGGTRSGPWSSN